MPVFRGDVRAGDAAAVRELVHATGFFSEEEVAVAQELVDAFISYGPDSTYRFVFAEAREGLRGYTCYGRIPLTRSSFDLYWIAVRPECQGVGLGRRLIELTEAAVRGDGGTQLFADTSSRPRYLPTRAFYRRLGYEPAAEFADFYAPGDNKIVYSKRLVAAA
jgi:ribosomal protein S18 acetylase RimI-like enzyme